MGRVSVCLGISLCRFMGHVICMQSLQQHNPHSQASVSGIQSIIIATYLPSTAYKDLLQVHITAVVPLLHQDQEINSLTLGRMKWFRVQHWKKVRGSSRFIPTSGLWDPSEAHFCLRANGMQIPSTWVKMQLAAMLEANEMSAQKQLNAFNCTVQIQLQFS